MKASLLWSFYLQHSFDSQNCVHGLNTETILKNTDLGKYSFFFKMIFLNLRYIPKLCNPGISI